jgi:hypothetical protein
MAAAALQRNPALAALKNRQQRTLLTLANTVLTRSTPSTTKKPAN